VKAYIDTSTSTQATAGGITVSATDDSSIEAEVYAPTVGIALSGTGSKSVSVGLSLSRNFIENDVTAFIDAATNADAAGNVTVTATSSATIDAFSAATAIGVAASGGATLSAGGGGATAYNTILGDAKAYIEDTNLATTAKGKVTVAASSNAQIDAEVLAAAIQAAIGADKATAVAIGAAIAFNLIGFRGESDREGNLVQATVRRSSIDADGDLDITASSAQSIDALVAAASVAIGASGGNSQAISVAGVYAQNKIDVRTSAGIDGDGATGISADGIKIEATDTSLIEATGGAAAITASFSGESGISVSVTAAVAQNEIFSTVTANILASDTGVTAETGDVTLLAKQDATIHATVASASLSIGAGGTNGIAVGGGGAAATNVILGSTLAYIDTSTVTSTAGDISVTANSLSEIDALVLAISGSASFGGTTGVSVAIGVAVALNSIGVTLDETKQTNSVSAYARNSRLNAGDALTITALSDQSIDATVVAGAVGLSGGGTTGVAVGGVGAAARNRISVDTTAYISGDATGGIDAASVSITANDQSDIESLAGAAAVTALLRYRSSCTLKR